MTRNQLPEGVGKKIVEALKRQAEADISPIEEEPAVVGNNLPLTDEEDMKFNFNETTADNNDNEIVEEIEEVEKAEEAEETPHDDDIINQPLFNIPEHEQEVQNNIPNIQFNQNEAVYYTKAQLTKERLEKTVLEASSQVSMPANVATLRKLIMGLPAGVTKQTGAQIIKQTFEAMGMPISTVLKEAQMFQEELNSSTREYMIKIQEYKTQIMQFEKAVQDYQQHITQINDLISLFLSSER